MTELSRRSLLTVSSALALSTAFGVSVASATDGAEERAPIWDLTDLYPSDAAWSAEHAAVSNELKRLGQFKGTLGRKSGSLRSALQAISDVNRRVARLSTYATLVADADTRVAASQERRQLASRLGTAVGKATAWLGPEILSMGAAKVAAHIATDRFGRFPVPA